MCAIVFGALPEVIGKYKNKNTSTAEFMRIVNHLRRDSLTRKPKIKKILLGNFYSPFFKMRLPIRKNAVAIRYAHFWHYLLEYRNKFFVRDAVTLLKAPT